MVSNATPRVVWFTGYSPDFPFYKIQHMKNGQWEDLPIGWCGVGVGRHRFAAHKTIRFTVPVEDDPQKRPVMRLGISCSAFKNNVEKTFWSETVEPKK